MSTGSIDQRHLANLLSIAKFGSFNRAAAARGISQPALSNSISQLERRLGVAVLDRTRRGSELNEIGRILVRNAEIIEAVLRQTAEEVRLKRQGIHGPIRIGVVPSLTIKFMPALMALLLKQFDTLAITVIEGLDDQLLPGLLSGDLDLVLGPLAGVFPIHPEIVEDALFDDAFSVGVGPSHPLANRRSLSLAELKDHPWILPLPGNNYRRHIEALFMTEGVPWPENCVLTSSLTLVESLLAQSNRVTIITQMQSMMQNTWHIKAIALKGSGKRTIGLKWRKAGALSSVADRFRQCAHELAAAVAPRGKLQRQAD